MYTQDGIVYASEPKEELEVAACRSVGDGILILTFSTGETRLFDSTCLLGMPAFRPLADESVLEGFEIQDGVLTWNNGEIDIATQALYARSFEYGQVA